MKSNTTIRLVCKTCGKIEEVTTTQKERYTEEVRKNNQCYNCKHGIVKKQSQIAPPQSDVLVEKKPKLTSRAKLIAEALISGGTLDGIAEIVARETKETNLLPIRSQVSGVLKNIKKGVGKWGVNYRIISEDKTNLKIEQVDFK